MKSTGCIGIFQLKKRSFCIKIRSMPKTFKLFESEAPNKETQNKPAEDESWLGCLEDCTEIHGDIVSPVMDENQWEALAE